MELSTKKANNGKTNKRKERHEENGGEIKGRKLRKERNMKTEVEGRRKNKSRGRRK